MEKQPTHTTAFDQFTQTFEAIISREVSNYDFLSMAKLAVETCRQQPEKRTEIAQAMTNLWLSNQSMGEDTTLDEIGGYFADLEVPDTDVNLEDHGSVEDKWRDLAAKIDDQIQQIQINN